VPLSGNLPRVNSPDGRWLATWDADGTTLLLDATTHQECARFSGHEAIINSATFSPDRRGLALCSKDGTIRLWEIGTGACQVLRGHTEEVFTVASYYDLELKPFHNIEECLIQKNDSGLQSFAPNRAGTRRTRSLL
jgi:WD40 repeat protein